MKIEGLIADVTSIGFPARAEHDIFRVILGAFWPIQAILWTGSYVVIWESPLEP